MTWRPELTVAAIVQRDDRFLIIEERIAERAVYNQPAGHVEDGESILDAVVRETLEETAWAFAPRHLVGTYLWRNPRNARTTLRFAIAGDVTRHDPLRRLDRGILGAHWRTRGELAAVPDRLRSPLVLRCIDDFLAGQCHDLAVLAHVADDSGLLDGEALPLAPLTLQPARR
jgi:8-oxo-dGTP pyrophosphatase MutT (NUDIX family)